MNFPINNFKVINTNKLKKIFYPKYGNLASFRPIISDNEGERWLCYIKKGAKMEPHSHTGRYEWYVISGIYLMKNTDTNESIILKRGDYYCNPPNIGHMHECLEDGEILWIYNQKEKHE